MPVANQKSYKVGHILGNVMTLVAIVAGVVFFATGIPSFAAIVTVLGIFGPIIRFCGPPDRPRTVIDAVLGPPYAADDPYLAHNPMPDPLARYEAELSTLRKLHATGVITSFDLIDRIEKLDDPKSPAAKIEAYVNAEGRTLGYGYTESTPGIQGHYGWENVTVPDLQTQRHNAYARSWEEHKAEKAHLIEDRFGTRKRAAKERPLSREQTRLLKRGSLDIDPEDVPRLLKEYHKVHAGLSRDRAWAAQKANLCMSMHDMFNMRKLAADYGLRFDRALKRWSADGPKALVSPASQAADVANYLISVGRKSEAAEVAEGHGLESVFNYDGIVCYIVPFEMEITASEF